MSFQTSYRLPVFLMAIMLGTVIWLSVIYPAVTYKVEKPEYNTYMAKEPADYKTRKDYTDLELAGRRLYFQEGCWNCHSQQARYQDRGGGPTAIPQEFAFDAPHSLGAERTGPDLAREGGKYPTRWHREHHLNPRSKYAGSIMPSFRHLDEQPLTFDVTGAVDARQLLGLNADQLREGLLKRTAATRSTGFKTPRGRNANDPWTDGILTPEETIYELRAIGYTDYDLVKFDGRGLTQLDALDAYIQSLGPNRMFEPGGPIPQFDNVPLAQDKAHPLSAAGAPTDWLGLAEHRATYWAPTEYQDLALKAKEDGKIPAFEPRFINNGRGIYLDKCAHCHGLNGQGNGPSGRYMMKKPANFWLPQFKQYSDAMWFYRIAEGVPGTEMPVWKFSLRQSKATQRWDQIWYLVTYLKYIAAASPMQPVPYDLPPEYYLFDQEKARQAAYPIDKALIEKHAEELAKAKAAADGAAPATGSAAAAPAAAAAPSSTTAAAPAAAPVANGKEAK